VVRMPKPPSGQHEQELKAFCDRLRADGYHVIETHGKIPDAIATKDGKLYAVEIVMKIRVKKQGKYGWKPMGGYTLEGKKRNYSMYDEVLIKQANKHPE